jgi:DnaK suppressor protein
VHEPEELTEAQQGELHTDLVELQRTLKEQLVAEQAASQPVELDQSAVGRLTRMAAMQVQEMSKANVRSLELRLGQVAQALRSADEQEYGYCRRCEEPVGYRRLKARPETPFCLACQGEIERR